MKKTITFTPLLITTFILSSCASIDFYEVKKDKTLENLGFLYYPPKPYLLIETKGENLTTKIISLPDLSNPHRVKQDNGWGTAELGFTIENGMIKTFNSKTDSKGPETITSLASLGTAKAELKAAKAAILTAELTPASIVEAKDNKGDKVKLPTSYTVNAFENSYKTIKNKVLLSLNDNKKIFKDEINTLTAVHKILKNKTTIKYEPLKPDALLSAVEERRKISRKLAIKLKNVSSTLDIYESSKPKEGNVILLAKNANVPLKNVIKEILGFSLRSSSVTGLYEIDFISGKLNLRKVVLE